MDARLNQLARELTDAISAAVGRDARVTACRERAATEGLDVRLTLEAIVTFVSRSGASSDDGAAAEDATKTTTRPLEMSANDRRFLKSLRISADEPTQKEVE
jgi:hypothetical protein